MTMHRRWSHLLLAAAMGLLMAACGGGGTATPPDGGARMPGAGDLMGGGVPGARTVTLRPVGGSGISGSAALTDMGGQTMVRLNITGSNETHPVHIHDGTCENLNPAPRYPLSNVQGGLSSTIVEASIQELSSGNKAINVHRSPTDLSNVACGNLP